MEAIVIVGLIIAIILCVIAVARNQADLVGWAGIVGFGVLVLARVIPG